MTKGRREETLLLIVETPNNTECWMASSVTLSQPEGTHSPFKDPLPPTPGNDKRWYRTTSGYWPHSLKHTEKINPVLARTRTPMHADNYELSLV